jgi:diguanylate cyclase (GGDEF)-like protein/PAS domain S-box-containing protein
MIGRRVSDFVDDSVDSDSVPLWFSLLSEGPGATRSARRRYLHPDGTGVWTDAAYLNRFEPGGGGFMLLLAFDITERRAQEQALQERTEEVDRLADEARRLAEDFRLLADESPAAVFRCDDQGRVTFHNARWTDLLGVDDDVIHLRGIVHPDVSSDLDRELAAALADTASEPRSFELRSASDERILGFRCRSIADVDPTRRRIVGSVEDVTATVRLRAEASHDPLTGLINRAAMDQALTSALHTDPTGTVVLFLDLDGFKEVNDEFGHDAGDIVLKEFAARLSSALRPDDVVGRYGGDEFVVLCRNVDPARTPALMRRLDRALDGPIHVPGGRWPASASVGAARPVPGDDLRSVMRRADQAMFEEKRKRSVARAVR